MFVRRFQPLNHLSTRLWQRSFPWFAAHRFKSTIAVENQGLSIPALIADLDRVAPRIDINPEQIQILSEPKDFYENLKAKVRVAKQRIFLCTLYIGKTEDELISIIRNALRDNGPDLRVSILTDVLRGTREAPEPSCASLLALLAKDFPAQVEIRMYHTPNLTGLRKALIPKRINEGWGLQHMKIYGFDDEVILSGANLSNDYFTNRQDRYYVFSSRRTTNYFATLHNAMCSISFLVRPEDGPSGYELEWPSSNPAPNPLNAPKDYIRAATSLLEPIAAPQSRQAVPTTSTSLYPVLCYPPNINTELPAFRQILSHPIASYTFTAGYFNPHPIIASSLIEASSHSTIKPSTVVTASPFANGFFGSRGISGMLPAAYTHLALRFLQAARGKSVQLQEWQRGVVGQKEGWTYHAKGLWVTLPKTTELPVGPSVTLIGSSNYTSRSYGLDLEAGTILVTNDERLMKKLRREEEMLVEPSRQVTENELLGKDRKASWKVRIAMWIVRVVGGAL